MDVLHANVKIVWEFLQSLMGTAHGTEELGLCSHGLACPGRRLGPLHRGLPRIWPYLEKSKQVMAGKNILGGP